MTKEQKLLINLLAYNISGKKIDFIKDIDWIMLIKESIAQTVSIVAFDSATVLKGKMPEDVYKLWFNHTYGSIALNSYVEDSQKELTQILDSEGYAYVILKGFASASYYDNPQLRSFGDVDFLIENDRKDLIKDVLVKNGYTASMEDHICHIVFNKPKSHLEMHFEISGIPNGEKGDLIRKYMADVFENVQLKKCLGETFNAPSHYHHALILLLHMQHHIVGEGIGLRHLMDWAYFVDKTHDMDFWDEKVIPFLKQIGLMRFANVFTALCVKYLGIRSPKWLKEVDCELLGELLEDILLGGNFGKKDKRRCKSAMLISNRGKDGTNKSKIYYLNKSLTNATYYSYPATKKYKILLPFAIIYRIMRYGFLRLIGKRSSLKSVIPIAEKRKNLYSRLHIFEVNNNE